MYWYGYVFIFGLLLMGNHPLQMISPSLNVATVLASTHRRYGRITRRVAVVRKIMFPHHRELIAHLAEHGT